MSKKQYLNLIQAAKYVKMTRRNLLYLIADGQGPPFEEIAGARCYRKINLYKWKRQRDKLKKTKTKGKATHADQPNAV